MHCSAFGSEGCCHLKFKSEAQIVFFLRHTWFTTRARHTSTAQRCFLCQTSQQVHKRSVHYLFMWHLFKRSASRNSPTVWNTQLFLYVAQELYPESFHLTVDQQPPLDLCKHISIVLLRWKSEFWLNKNSKQEQAESGLAERNPPGSFSPKMSRLKCRHLHSDYFLCRWTLVDISCNRWKFLSSEKLSVVVTNDNHRFTKQWNAVAGGAFHT